LMHAVLAKMFLARLLATTVMLTAFALGVGGAATIWQRMSARIPRSASASVASKPTHSPAPAHAMSSVSGRNLGDTASPSPIRLPTDPNVAVLRMDRSVDSSTGPSAVLTIYADGRVVVQIPDGLTSLSATDLSRYAQHRVQEQNS